VASGVEELPSAASSDAASSEAFPEAPSFNTDAVMLHVSEPSADVPQGGPPYAEDIEPQSVVASANPAAPAAKRAERDSRPTTTRAGALTGATSLLQNGHVHAASERCVSTDLERGLRSASKWS
jgi:hypothetical protein